MYYTVITHKTWKFDQYVLISTEPKFWMETS